LTRAASALSPCRARLRLTSEALDGRLRDSGDLVYNEGLADPSQAKVVRLENGQPVAPDGLFAEAQESIIDFWVIDVASEERALELCAEILAWSGAVEVRPVPSGPPAEYL
jgi:hypothetical protein